MSSKCKSCCDKIKAKKRGYVYGGGASAELDDRAFLEAELNSRVGDYNVAPREYHGGAYQADGVRSVRGKKTKNRSTKRTWGNVRGQIKRQVPNVTEDGQG